MTLTLHAARRLREHGIFVEALRQVIADPFLAGPAAGSASFACGPGYAGQRRTWITAVLDCDTGDVATVYPGPPTESCRMRPMGEGRP